MEDPSWRATWIVQDFSTLTQDEVQSPRYNFGGHYWYEGIHYLVTWLRSILLYPSKLSIYLTLEVAPKKPVKIECSFSVANRVANKNITISFSRTYSKQQSFGVKDIAGSRLADIRDPVKGFLRNGTDLVIHFKLRVSQTLF